MDGGFPFRAFEALQQITRFAPSDLSCVAVCFMSVRDKAREGSRLLLSSLKEPAIAVRQVRRRPGGDLFQAGMAAIGAYGYVDEYMAQVREVRSADGRPPLADWREFLRYCGLDSVPLAHVDHHVAHAAGAYYTSGWDAALVITADGVGGLKSGIVATGRGGELEVLARTFLPHSAGRYWEAITAICGFHHMKHGGKITGLAAYGDPKARAYEVMAEALVVDGMTIRSALDPVRMAHRLQGLSREDIAATAQRRLEEVLTALVQRSIRQTGLRRVALAGGVFANVRLNQRVADLPECEAVYVFPAMGDEGLALGAALQAAGQRARLQPARLEHVYLGPECADGEVETALQQEGVEYRKLGEPALAQEVTDLLAGGKVVGLFRGRMEFGPRALGHRSVLYQTTDATVNDWLNKRLRRTEFMPFAPVTLDEHADRCYLGLATRRHAARFMTITCDCTDWMKRVSPAVVHVDGTARPQLVTPEVEPFLADVLRRYQEKTGIPSLINTSFNMHEEPIVCRPLDAIRAFRRGPLDGLAIGSFLVSPAGARKSPLS
jgi:carbamoyltransferase